MIWGSNLHQFLVRLKPQSVVKKAIYLATSGEYSDYQVCHAFAKREDAESYKLGDDVKEMEVRDGPVEVRTWHTLNWRADWPEREAEAGFVAGNPHPWTERRDFDGDERR